MRDRAVSFWFWPGWRQLGFALGLGVAEGALFVAIYGGADWITHQHSFRVRVHTDADLAIPFVPAAAALYLSLNFLFWIGPFVLRSRRELTAYVLTLAVATLVAGAFFVAIPIADAFPLPSEASLGRWSGVYHLATSLALRHNYLPSLHVAFTAICILVYSGSAGVPARMALFSWGAAIITSTLLIHAHYLADVVSGLILGWSSVHFVYRRRLNLPLVPMTETRPANRSQDPTPSV